MNTSTCPRHDVLVAYQTGELTETSVESVTSHVVSCPACQAELKTIRDTEDTFVSRLRASLAEKEAFLDEPGCAAAIAQVQAAVGSLARAAASAAVIDSIPPDLRQLGEYQLIEKLGEGGMGAVYKARQTNLDRLVALKVLPKDRSENKTAIARFYREMRAVGRLCHQNIVQAFDAREIDGSPVLVMEYVDGLDLSRLVRLCGPLPVADACELIRQTALGLQYAHQQGLVHRDIKPSNLMLTTVDSSRHTPCAVAPAADGTRSVPATLGLVKILDLGLALLQAGPAQDAEMTAAGSAMGTADYIAPEQVTDSHNVDIRADIYSLGCTLYKLLASRAPFVGPEYKNDVAKMMAHVHETPPPITELRTDLPADLAAIVQRMMAKEPSQRYGTPAEVAAALAPFAAGCDLANVLSRTIQFVEPTAADPARSATTGQLSASPVSDTTPRPQPVISAEAPASQASLAVTRDVSPLAPVLQGEGSGERGGSRRRLLIALAAAAAAIPLLLGVWVIIRDKGGGEVGRFKVPEGGSASLVDDQGQPVQSKPVPAEQPKVEPKTSKPEAQPQPAPRTVGPPVPHPKPVPTEIKP